MSIQAKSIFRKWHRRIGIVSAFFMLVLASSGIVLLFASSLGLDRANWSGALIEKMYAQNPASAPVGIKLDNGGWVVMVENLVYLGAQDPIVLNPPLVRAVIKDELVHISNHDETIICLADGTLVERVHEPIPTGAMPAPLPDRVRINILVRFGGRGVAASKVLLDVHTGRILGPVGPWIMAISGLFLMALSLSGIFLWLRRSWR